MNKKVFIGVAFIIAAVAIGIVFLYQGGNKAASNRTLPTYFTYSTGDLAPLQSLKAPSTVITQADLIKWDQEMFSWVSSHKWADTFASRMYAYTLMAQRDAAFLSFNANQKFTGTVGPISKKIGCEFFPDSCADIVSDSDAYSEALADIVMKKVKARIAEDAQMTKLYELKTGDTSWTGPDPRIGQDSGSWKPWFLASGDQFRVEPPPHPVGTEEMIKQLALVKDALANITETQRQSVIFWAGNPGTKTPPGQWIQITDDYLRDQGISVEQSLIVRSALSAAVADAVIAVFDSKYTHFLKRPFMMDGSIITIMPTPNHPSYPAGHATLSSAAATILSHYFPAESKKWDDLKLEAGNGRTWGGIHFPIDNTTGFVLGQKVAEEAIRQLK